MTITRLAVISITDVKVRKKLNSQKIVGVEYAEGTPVPIPNTEVKLGGAKNTWVATPRENREMPILFKVVVQ